VEARVSLLPDPGNGSAHHKARQFRMMDATEINRRAAHSFDVDS
jgi:hypothetical protein